MRKEWLNISQKGFSVVEVLLASSIFVLLVTALVGAYIYGQESTALSGVRTRAAFLADEGIEASRNIRDESFSNITAGTKGLVISGNQWAFWGSSDITDIFSRSLIFSTIDTRRMSVSSKVSWSGNLQRSDATLLETDFTNWLKNFGNWASPTQQGSADATGGADGNEIALYKTATATYAILVRNSSANTELEVTDVTDPSTPLIVGSVELGADAFDVAVSGNYALVASAHTSQELQVVDLSTPTSPTLVGSFDATGPQNARAVTAHGNTVFLGRNQSANIELYAISIATPSSPLQLGTLELSEDVRKMALAQNNQYLYVATTDNSEELVIISVSNPSSMSQVGTYNGGGNSDGTAMTAFSTYAVLGRADGNIEIIQASSPASPTLIGGPIDIGSRVNDLSMGAGDIYLFAASNTAATSVSILNVVTPSLPAILGSAITTDTNGIVWDFDLDLSIVATVASSAEIVSIRPN